MMSQLGRPRGQYAQASKMFQLCRALQRAGDVGVAVAEIAELLGLSERGARRYVRALRDHGASISRRGNALVMDRPAFLTVEPPVAPVERMAPTDQRELVALASALLDERDRMRAEVDRLRRRVARLTPPVARMEAVS